MTVSSDLDLKSACAFVRSCLGERPAVTCVAERGALDLDRFLDASPGLWHPESSGSDPAPFKLYSGRIGGAPVVVVTETPPFSAVRRRTFPVELAAGCECGAAILLATAIPLHPEWQPGGVMGVEDHINLLGDTPLIGRDVSPAIPFLDMENAYDRALLGEAVAAAELERIPLKLGVFVASPLAQSYDPSALAMLREAGGDACGTGIVPHVLAARDASISVLAICTLREMEIANVALNPSLSASRLSEETASRLTAIVRRLIRDRVGSRLTRRAFEGQAASGSTGGRGTN